MPRSTPAGSKKASAPAKAAKTAKPAKATATKAKKAPSAGAKAPPAKAATKAATKAAPTKTATKAAKAPSNPTKGAKAGTANRAPEQAAEKAPSRKKASFPARWLTAQQKALLNERASYTRQADSLKAEADALVADFEPGDVQFDEESGEGDTLNIERERDLALSAQARQAVEEIDHALAKFDLGTYGICEISGEPIPVERLEAIPWARERVEYKTGGLGRR